MNIAEVEWSMGNGQCPLCGGKGPSFAAQEPPAEIGHTPGCLLLQPGGIVRGSFLPTKEQQIRYAEHRRYMRCVFSDREDLSAEDRDWLDDAFKPIWTDRVPKRGECIV